MTADLPTLAAAESPFCLSDTAAQVGMPSAQTCSDTDRCLGPVLTGLHIMPASASGRTLGFR